MSDVNPADPQIAPSDLPKQWHDEALECGSVLEVLNQRLQVRLTESHVRGMQVVWHAVDQAGLGKRLGVQGWRVLRTTDGGDVYVWAAQEGWTRVFTFEPEVTRDRRSRGVLHWSLLATALSVIV